MHRPAVTACAMLFASAAGCFNAPVEELAVWSEAVPLEAVAHEVETLVAFDSTLYLAVSDQDLQPELAAFLHEAQAAGLTVVPWLQLPEHGLWLNEGNVRGFTVLAEAYLEWAEQQGCLPHALLFDLEPSKDYLEALLDAAGWSDLSAVMEIASGHLDPTGFALARERMNAMIDRLGELGVEAWVVTFHLALDDAVDGDTDLQDLFDIPLDGVAWDKVIMMLYRPMVVRLTGVPLSPGFVGRYADLMRDRFGDRAEVAVGQIGTVGVTRTEGYESPLAIGLDISAAASKGVTAFSLFSLDGMLTTGGLRPWLDAATRPTWRLAYPSIMTYLIRSVTLTLDLTIHP